MKVVGKLESVRVAPRTERDQAYVDVVVRDVRLGQANSLLQTPIGSEVVVCDAAALFEAQPPSFLQAQLRELEEMFNKQRGELVEARRLLDERRRTGPVVVGIAVYREMERRALAAENQLAAERAAFKQRVALPSEPKKSAETALYYWAWKRGGCAACGLADRRAADWRGVWLCRGCVYTLDLDYERYSKAIVAFQNQGFVEGFFLAGGDMQDEVVRRAAEILTKSKPSDPRFAALDLSDESET